MTIKTLKKILILASLMITNLSLVQAQEKSKEEILKEINTQDYTVKRSCAEETYLFANQVYSKMHNKYVLEDVKYIEEISKVRGEPNESIPLQIPAPMIRITNPDNSLIHELVLISKESTSWFSSSVTCNVILMYNIYRDEQGYVKNVIQLNSTLNNNN